MFERGSEWRRWDLHIHTPETKKNDNYAGKNINEKWDNFYKTIEDYIRDDSNARNRVAAIGITDYFSIDNYRKVIGDKRLPSEIIGRHM